MKKTRFDHASRIPFDVDQCLADFFTKGFYVFSAEAAMCTIPIDKFKVVTEKHPDNCFHAEGHEFHSELQTRNIMVLRANLTALWLSKIAEHELIFDFYSDKCNDHVVNFHSDAQYAHPGQNATVNCFFDDMSPEVGGRFDMAPYRADLLWTSDGVPGMSSVYPKKFDVIIFNQNRNFMHKVIPASVTRRMISFACVLKDINPLHPNWVPG